MGSCQRIGKRKILADEIGSPDMKCFAPALSIRSLGKTTLAMIIATTKSSDAIYMSAPHAGGSGRSARPHARENLFQLAEPQYRAADGRAL